MTNNSEGVWKMTETEFKRELARAWDEGYEAADYDAPHATKSENPYRSAEAGE